MCTPSRGWKEIPKAGICQCDASSVPSLWVWLVACVVRYGVVGAGVMAVVAATLAEGRVVWGSELVCGLIWVKYGLSLGEGVGTGRDVGCERWERDRRVRIGV